MSEEIVQKYQSHKSDTGSTKVQIALLSEKIKELTAHLQEHRHDFDSRSGLLKMVGKRRRLLNYISSNDNEGYQALIKDLGLRK